MCYQTHQVSRSLTWIFSSWTKSTLRRNHWISWLQWTILYADDDIDSKVIYLRRLGFKQVLEKRTWWHDIDKEVSLKCLQCIFTGHTDSDYHREDENTVAMWAYAACFPKQYRPSGTTDKNDPCSSHPVLWVRAEFWAD